MVGLDFSVKQPEDSHVCNDGDNWSEDQNAGIIEIFLLLLYPTGIFSKCENVKKKMRRKKCEEKNVKKKM